MVNWKVVFFSKWIHATARACLACCLALCLPGCYSHPLSNSEQIQKVLDRDGLISDNESTVLAVVRNYRSGSQFVVVRGMRGAAPLEQEFPIASLTKQFTAYAILTFRDQGLDLFEPIDHFLPGLTRVGKPVRVLDLLLQDTNAPEYTSDVRERRCLTQSDARSVHRCFGAQRLSRARGFLYSNTNYYLLGLIIAQLSRTSYQTYILRHVIPALGLRHTRFDARGDTVFHAAFAAGGLKASAADILAWDRFLLTTLNGRRFLNTAARYAIPVQSDIFYGFGQFVSKHDGRTMFFHSGIIGDYRAFNLVVPSIQVAVLIMTQHIDVDLTAVGLDLANLQASGLN